MKELNDQIKKSAELKKEIQSYNKQQELSHDANVAEMDQRYYQQDQARRLREKFERLEEHQNYLDQQIDRKIHDHEYLRHDDQARPQQTSLQLDSKTAPRGTYKVELDEQVHHQKVIAEKKRLEDAKTVDQGYQTYKREFDSKYDTTLTGTRKTSHNTFTTGPRTTTIDNSDMQEAVKAMENKVKAEAMQKAREKAADAEYMKRNAEIAERVAEAEQRNKQMMAQDLKAGLEQQMKDKMNTNAEVKKASLGLDDKLVGRPAPINTFQRQESLKKRGLDSPLKLK